MGKNIEGRERLFVVVAEVVEKDGLGGWGGDGEDVAGGVPGGEVGAGEVELAGRVLGGGVPDTESVVFRAGEEGVLAGVEG